MGIFSSKFAFLSRIAGKATLAPKPGTSAMVILFLAQPTTFNHDKIVASLRQRHPEHDWAMPPERQGEHGCSALFMSGQIVGIMSIPTRGPDDGWREVAKASSSWPEALKVCEQHQAIALIVATGQPGDLMTPARIATAVAGALVASHPGAALGGHWKNAYVLNKAEAWDRLAQHAFEPAPDIPASLWVSRFLIRQAPSGGSVVLTRGLDKFIDREVEVIGSSDQTAAMMKRAKSLTQYLLQHGMVVNDGDTVDLSETEHLLVRVGTARDMEDLPVVSVTLLPPTTP
jgi:hypothetical protein